MNNIVSKLQIEWNMYKKYNLVEINPSYNLMSLNISVYSSIGYIPAYNRHNDLSVILLIKSINKLVHLMF